MNAALNTAMNAQDQRHGAILRRMSELATTHCENSKTLELTLRELVALSAELAAIKARKALLQTFAELLQTTPAKSGYARSGWSLSATSDHPLPQQWNDKDDYDDARVNAAITETLNNLPENVFETLSLGNAVPYLALLEAGLSAQAPAGFVSRATENLRARLASAARA